MDKFEYIHIYIYIFIHIHSCLHVCSPSRYAFQLEESIEHKTRSAAMEANEMAQTACNCALNLPIVWKRMPLSNCLRPAPLWTTTRKLVCACLGLSWTIADQSIDWLNSTKTPAFLYYSCNVVSKINSNWLESRNNTRVTQRSNAPDGVKRAVSTCRRALEILDSRVARVQRSQEVMKPWS